jgi:prepilin signal peptidase PulO-like enzyme (type II secretory pathway)
VANALTPSPVLDLLALVFGLLVGSYLNVVALRTLAEQSIVFPASHCPRCKQPIAPWDNIPVLSWFILAGKCRNCRGPIHWQYPLVEAFTGFTFVALERCFLDINHSPFNSPYWNHLLGAYMDAAQQMTLDSVWKNAGAWIITQTSLIGNEQLLWLLAGGIFLACTLIAVTVTDFREKLIPHDITYPSMLVGILFSAIVRHDLLGAMAGIGASYILFDFIAFYGLKIYLATHGADEPGRKRRLRRRLPPRRRRRLSRLLRWRVDLASLEVSGDEEPVEVMGGGDAVLSAVMAAYLGWQLLSIALIFGFVIGTFMGLVLLINEMRKANLLHKCARISGIGILIGATVFGCLGALLDRTVGMGATAITIPMCILGAAGGALLGLVSVGTRVSKPYPFGPALAAGGFIAIFLLPNWVYLSAMAPTQH